LAEGKLCYVLKSSSFAMRESFWLEGLIFHLQNMIYNHVHTHTNTPPHLSMLLYNKPVKKRAKKDMKNPCPFCNREQGVPMCQSFSQEGLLFPVCKTNRKWKHSKGFF
jgi:hypothetical protein